MYVSDEIDEIGQRESPHPPWLLLLAGLDCQHHEVLDEGMAGDNSEVCGMNVGLVPVREIVASFESLCQHGHLHGYMQGSSPRMHNEMHCGEKSPSVA